MFIAGATAATAAGLGVSAVLAVLCAKEALSALVTYLPLRGDLARSTGPPRCGGSSFCGWAFACRSRGSLSFS